MKGTKHYVNASSFGNLSYSFSIEKSIFVIKKLDIITRNAEEYLRVFLNKVAYNLKPTYEHHTLKRADELCKKTYAW